VPAATPKTLAIGAGALIAVGLLAWTLRGPQPGASSTTAGRADLPHFTGTPNREAETPPEPAMPVEEQVRQVMQRWRTSILNRQAEGVLDCDHIFHERPTLFSPALRTSAESDDDERVRAFSTRMLGKLRDAGNTDLFAKLLADASPSVRGNAAWALGQLHDPRSAALLEQANRPSNRSAHPDQRGDKVARPAAVGPQRKEGSR
jgi:hypothetical protein